MMMVLKIVAGALGIGLAGLGVAWIVVPEFAASQLGMDLLDGAGLSSQIGDGAGYFVTLGGCILLGLSLRERLWFYPAISLLFVATIGRLSAWLFHDAALTVDMILFEVVLVALLLGISPRLRPEE